MAISIGIAGFSLFNSLSDDSHDPLDYRNPQTIVFNLSNLRPGGTVYTSGTKCNRSDKDIPVTADTFWRELTTGKLTVRSSLTSGIRIPGCETKVYPNRIPEDLPPGMYRIEGYESARIGNVVQREEWNTESFEVQQ